jgi:class 3 adenylate cyclase
MDETAGSGSVRINPYNLTFDDRDLERRFRAEHFAKAARSSRLAVAAGAPGYLLLYLILDDPDAQRVVAAMVAVALVWIPVSWSRVYLRHYEPLSLVAISLLIALSLLLVIRLPPMSAVLVAIAVITLNYMWLFVFLRPRVPWGLAVGTAYLVAVVPIGAVIWDEFGSGDAPEGMVELLAGRRGGAIIVLCYGAFLLGLMASVAFRLERAERVDFVLRDELADAHARSERLLTNILPVPVAERLKRGESPIADDCPEVSVVFADIVGFTELSASMAPADLVLMLDDVFRQFDELASRHGLEKIKTIGDAYMAVAGVPEPNAHHAQAAAEMALDMVDAVTDLNRSDGVPVQVRVGIGSGPAVAGVIGTSKFIYDLWGDTVNTASRMESQGVVGRVQVSEATRARLGDAYELEDRGPIAIKGKGTLHTWLLAAR